MFFELWEKLKETPKEKEENYQHEIENYDLKEVHKVITDDILEEQIIQRSTGYIPRNLGEASSMHNLNLIDKIVTSSHH